MNKNIFLLSLVLLAVVFTSCTETKEVGKYDNWRARNEAFIDSLQAVYDAKTDLTLDTIHLLSDPNGCIFYKKLTPVGSGVIENYSPLYTDKVSMYYKGTLIIGETFDGNFDGANPNIDFSQPTNFIASGVVTGWAETLQRMKVGERWLIYIPWKYAYGVTGDDNILGYTTLIFDMQLLKIVEE